MGPLFLIKGTRANPANKLEWAQYYCGRCQQQIWMGELLFIDKCLPIGMNGPIYFYSRCRQYN
jgi:hypothetical protein